MASRTSSYRTYPDFGYALFESLYWVQHGKRFPRAPLEDDWKAAEEYLIKAVETESGQLFPYSRSDVKRWLMYGKLAGKKPFTFENLNYVLRDLVREKVPWLRTQQDIEQLINLGRPDYIVILREAFVVELPETPIAHYWGKNGCFLSLPVPLFRRQLFSDVLHKRIPAIKGRGTPLVLYGQSGHGKTVLLSWLARQQSLRRHFDRVLCIRGGKKDELDDWLRSIHFDFFGNHKAPDNPTILISKLKAFTRGKKILYLLDNCNSTALLDRLQDLLSSGSFAIVTVLAGEGLSESVPALFRYEVPRFHQLELIEYYAGKYNPDPDEVEKEHLLTLGEALGYNMRALRPALARTANRNWDWKDTLGYFRKAAFLPQNSLENSVYRSLSLAYQELSVELQRALRALGALPTRAQYDLTSLTALWDISASQARRNLNMLNVQAGIGEKAGDDRWMFDDSVLLFARELLDRASIDEQKQARSWLKRRIQQDVLDTLPVEMILKRTQHLFQGKRSGGKSRKFHPFVMRVLKFFLNWDEEKTGWEGSMKFSRSYLSGQDVLADLLEEHNQQWEIVMRTVLGLLVSIMVAGIVSPADIKFSFSEAVKLWIFITLWLLFVFVQRLFNGFGLGKT